MVDREKVIHGLNSCGNDDGHPDRCGRTECPYRDNGAWCTHELAHDAGVLVSELLNAQKPRLVTIDDFKDADECGYITAWCEASNGIFAECITVDALEEKDFRYWTSRPDQATREATPWE